MQKQHTPQQNTELRELPVHPGAPEVSSHVLRVDGLVGRPLALTAADLQDLTKRDVTADFSCLEGWTVRNLKWRGVSLEAVLALADARPEAQWVWASAGNFSINIPIQDVRLALLATRLGNDALPVEHGGPVRLVVLDGDCYTSIKWLDHLELRVEPGANTGKTIALNRLRSSKTG